MALTTIGRLNYNGVEFDGSLEIRVSVQAVPDETGLTIKYYKITIFAHAVVTNSAGADASMQAIRNALMEPAQTLIFLGKGFGNDLQVSSANDVMGGPTPRMLSWTPIGANKAVEFDWEVDVHVGCGFPYTQYNVMSFAYELAFRIDEHGLTTQTVTGSLEIRQNRKGRVIANTADAFLTLVLLNLPDGFKRSQTRNLSKDKARLDFTITDTQIASNNPYPLYSTAIRGRHRVRWNRGPNGTALMNSLSVEFSPKLGVSGTQAWAYFLNLLAQRIKAASGDSRRVFIESLDVDEDIFGLPCSFGCSYRILNTASGPNAMTDMVKGIVDIPGLWQPLDTDWSKWRASLADVFSQRGLAGMKHIAGVDVVVDLCVNSNPPPIPVTSPPSINPPTPVKPKIESPYNPDRVSSYLCYQNIISPSASQPVTRQSISQDSSYQTKQPDTGGGDLQDGYPRFPVPTGYKDVLQQGGNGRYGITMVGHAERAGWPIAKPFMSLENLTNIGDSAIKEVSSNFAQVVGDSSFGVPVYKAAWQISYMLCFSPQEVRPHKNISEGMRV